MANKNSLLKSLSTVLLTRDLAGGGSTTLLAAAAKGATILSLTSGTNFTVGDTVRVGSGSKTELATLIAGQVSPLFAISEPLARDHAIGEVVVEQTAYDVGDITDAGVDVTVGRETSDVPVATRRMNYTIMLGYGNLEAGFSLPGLTMENIALALGMPLSTVQGTGASSVAPKHVVTDLTDIAGEQNVSLVCIGVTMDGTPVRVELWNVDPDYTGFSLNLRRGTLNAVPARFIATGGGRVSANASAYVANTTIRATKGKVFDALTEVGYFTNGPTAGGTGAATTIAAPTGGSNVKGQFVITVAAATNIAVGDWLKLGSADTVEFHRVGSIVTTQVTLDTRLLRDQAVGVAVVEQTLVPFANIHPDGVTFTIAGSLDRLREATSVFAIGTRASTARASLGFGILDFIPTALARAAGVDPATIVSNTFNIDEKIGANLTDGVYARGVTQDGSTTWLVMYGCSQDIGRTALTMATSGQPQVPTSWVPASGILLMQHT
jgi:hypothetical protein